MYSVNVSSNQTDFFNNDNVFVLVDAAQNTEFITRQIGQALLDNNPKNLADVKRVVFSQMRLKIEAEPISYAIGVVVHHVFYLITYGEGKILLVRDKTLFPVLSGDSNASGFIKPNDSYIFQIGNSLIHLESFVPLNFQDRILYIEFGQEIESQPLESLVLKKAKVPFTQSLHNLILSGRTIEKKKITFALIIVLFILFLWSVVFGVTRRNNALQGQAINKVRDEVQANLSEASDLATLNTTRAQMLIEDSRQKVAVLQKQVPKTNKEVLTLVALIDQKEKTIFKKEDKSYVEFYDLHLIDNAAVGDMLAMSGDTISVLDKNKGGVYTISISKKSKNAAYDSTMKNGQLIAQWRDITYVLTNKGIEKISNGNFSLAVKYDPDWGAIRALSVYNDNIYLLDASKQMIYKYLVTDNGYSDKINYLKNSFPGLAQSTNMVIDSSIYVSSPENIYKFTAGAQDGFTFSKSEVSSLLIHSIFTDQASTDIYILDKSHGFITVINKQGEYQKQITSSVLSQSKGFAVSEESKSIFVLNGNMIEAISLN